MVVGCLIMLPRLGGETPGLKGFSSINTPTLTIGMCHYAQLSAVLIKYHDCPFIILLHFTYFVCMYVCAWVYMCHGVHVEVRGQLSRLSSFSSTMWFHPGGREPAGFRCKRCSLNQLSVPTSDHVKSHYRR